MFEKYDGIRGFWNPLHKTFFSRTGKSFSFPDSITSNMPNIFLDGELWCVYECFSSVVIPTLFFQVWSGYVPRSGTVIITNELCYDRLEEIQI
jgi:hypothetical protein